jgi:RNA polymerase sigma-70 factor (ECF subfamily)
VGTTSFATPDLGVSRGTGSELADTNTSWVQLAEDIERGDPSAIAYLYEFCSTKIRWYFQGRVRFEDIEDRVHEVFLAVFASIQQGNLRDPTRMLEFLWGVARKQVFVQIRQEKRGQTTTETQSNLQVVDVHPLADEVIDSQERRAHAAHALARLDFRDREILIRFYLLEQPREQIQSELRMSPTQFRLAKSRAKDRFARIGRAQVQQGSQQTSLSRSPE